MANRLWGGKVRRTNECGHPERRHCARGMCDACYNAWLERRLRERDGPRDTNSGVHAHPTPAGAQVLGLTEASAIEITGGAFLKWGDRRCPVCRQPLRQWEGEGDEVFARRLCCDSLCEILGIALSSQWRRLFPGATYRMREEVPERCQCGGPWRDTQDGVVCMVCSRAVAVAQYLVQSVLFSRRAVKNEGDGGEE